MRKGWRFLAAALLLACSPEYEVLRSPSGQQAGSGSEGAVGGTGTGGSFTGGLGGAGGTGTAPIVGGEPSEGGESSEGGIGGVAGTATGGTGVAGEGTGGNCASHLDCGAGTVCSASQCVACPDTPNACSGPCDHGFQPVLADHNGCALCECAPASECTSNAGCPAGEQCYPGAQCEPGCNEPSCCAGNRCSGVGCAGSPIPHCLAAGCAGGAVCLAACNAVTCECVGAAWQCAESPGAAGAPSGSCPQACVSP